MPRYAIEQVGMFQSLVSLLTIAAMGLQALFGCCGHHSHGAEAAHDVGVDTQQTSKAALIRTASHSSDHADEQIAFHGSDDETGEAPHSPFEPCDGCCCSDFVGLRASTTCRLSNSLTDVSKSVWFATASTGLTENGRLRETCFDRSISGSPPAIRIMQRVWRL
ncbi:hypothetical protein Pan189_19400 [Stratiformator vulcanicus]|uniref:Uncharacterized protein n=1 Tax=Stratiformator vulcanicus TaxID=2527980 RepID=A0A517R139_9PLAN|nr:hypothetical protein Pan189_19400 [Stratiformator vulcanicus]